MSPDDVAKYKSLYIETARKYLIELRENVALLQSEESHDAIRTCHIAAHSLKSQSAVIGYTQISTISSTIEALFRAKEEGTGELDSAALEQVQHDVEKMLALVEEIEKT